MAAAASTVPSTEAERIAAVRRYDILDTPPDGAFDRITALAARLFEVPIAIISIVDEDRIWFKSHHGISTRQVSRDPGLCASAIMAPDPHILTDASIDPRSLSNPLVAGEFGLRFYAGVPLRTSDGHNLGALCIIDKEARPIDKAQIEDLKDLASVVMDQLELQLSARRAVTRVELMAKELAAMARTDDLTGLANRRALGERLAEEWARVARYGRSLAVVTLDVDHFKKYNDQFGHQAGDECLKKVAQALGTTGRSTDFPARSGGEEFVILLPETDLAEAQGVAERVRIAIERLRIPHPNSPSGFVTASLGVAATTASVIEAPEGLLHEADKALYSAKHEGRNRVALASPRALL